MTSKERLARLCTSKRALCIALVLFVMVASVFLFLFLHNRNAKSSRFSENSSEISTAWAFGGFSPQGILYVQREPYLWYCDFETSTEVPFCSKPACTHDNLSCVAYHLLNDQSMIGAEMFNLYDGKLYFTKRVYDRLSEHQYTIEVYAMNVDGSGERKLASLDGYDWCTDVHIVDGKILLILNKYIEENEDIADGNKKREVKTFACIDISSGSLQMLPEKSGYTLQLMFIGCGNEKLYYVIYYAKEQLDFDIFHDDFSVFSQEWLKKGRITLWVADLTDGTEQPWGNGKFHDVRLENLHDSHSFRYANGVLAHYEHSGDSQITVITAYDAQISHLISTKAFDYNSVGGGGSYNWHGEWEIFSKYDNTGFHVEKHTAYNFVTGEMIEVDSFGNHTLLARVADKLIFFDTEPNASGYTPYCWMSLDDFLQGSSEIKSFERVS